LELIAGLFTNKDAIDKTMLQKPKKKRKRAPKGVLPDDSKLYIGDISFAQQTPEDADNKIWA
jgi:hypothetical protein